MKTLIEIKDTDSEGILVSLRALLRQLEPWGPDLSWSILALEVQGEPWHGMSILEVEQAVAESNDGFQLSWAALTSLATSVEIGEESVMVGVKPGSGFPRLPLSAAFYERCEVCIEAFDFTLWRVYARDERVLKRLETAFETTTIVTINSS